MKSRLVKASFAFAAALVFISVPVGATTTLTTDGVWWQGLSEDEKTFTIEGMVSGYNRGYEAGRSDGWYEAIHVLKVPISEQTAASKFASEPPPPKKPKFSKTVGIYIDEINLWYKTHPKRTSISPSQLLDLCFVDEPLSPTGVTCDDIGKDADK